MKLVGTIGLLLAISVSSSLADDGQGAMTSRVLKFASAYAEEIELRESFVTYCLTEMNMHTNHPTDGSIPYGVNYNTAPKSTIDSAVRVREIYEKHYLQLCLADAKTKLTSAKR